MAIFSKIEVISTTDIPDAVKALPNSVKTPLNHLMKFYFP
jgi:hypothetical protein